MANKCTTQCCYTTLNDVVTCDTVEYNCGDTNPCRGYRGGGRVMGAYRSTDGDTAMGSSMPAMDFVRNHWGKLLAVVGLAATAWYFLIRKKK